MGGVDLTNSYGVSSGEKGYVMAESNAVATMTFLLQMKRVKQSRLVGLCVSTIILPCLKWSMSQNKMITSWDCPANENGLFKHAPWWETGQRRGYNLKHTTIQVTGIHGSCCWRGYLRQSIHVLMLMQNDLKSSNNRVFVYITNMHPSGWMCCDPEHTCRQMFSNVYLVLFRKNTTSDIQQILPLKTENR